MWMLVEAVFKTQINTRSAGIHIQSPGIQRGFRLGGIIYPALMENIES